MNRGYIVPDDMTMQKLSAQTKAQLREKLIGSLRALRVPEPVIVASDRVHYVRALDPAQIARDARVLLSTLPVEDAAVVAERQALLDAVSAPRRRAA